MQTVGKNAYYYRLLTPAILFIIVEVLFFIIFLTTGTSQQDLMGLLLLTGIFLVVFCIWAFFVYLSWKNLKYNIEANALVFQEGLLSLSSITIPFTRITNAEFNQSLFQRLFSVGTVVVDQENTSFKWNNIDKISAQEVSEVISKKSNIQPFAAAK